MRLEDGRGRAWTGSARSMKEEEDSKGVEQRIRTGTNARKFKWEME